MQGTTEASDTSTSGWGQWPGAVDLLRANRGGGGGSLSLHEPHNVASSRWGAFQGIHHRKPPHGRTHGPFLSYQRQVRILFTWKPPALPESESGLYHPPDNVEMGEQKASNSAWVVLLSGIPWWMTDCDIREAGSAYGQVRAVRILGNVLTGYSTGLALMEYTQKNSVSSLLADKGFHWKPCSENDRVGIQFHALPIPIINQLTGGSHTGTFEDCGLHWSLGTFLGSDLLKALYDISHGSSSSTGEPNSPRSSGDLQDAVAAKSSRESLYSNFKFPFAAAAVIAQVLKANMTKDDSQNALHARKRSHTGSAPSEGENILDCDVLSHIDDVRVPYWGAVIHPPVRLPAVPRVPSTSSMTPREAYYKMLHESEMVPMGVPCAAAEFYPPWGGYTSGVPAPMEIAAPMPIPGPPHFSKYGKERDTASSFYLPYT